MALHPLAGKPATPDMLINVEKLVSEYYSKKPDLGDPQQLVSFGTSGHRGSSEDGSFTEAHILAVTQAICEYRKGKGINGPLIMGKDTHALSSAAERTALEVLIGNGVKVMIQENDGFMPTPVVSHSILQYNRAERALADGIVITPSHNPPKDGGFKYNPPNGGPADTDVTDWVQNRANELLKSSNNSVQRVAYETAIKSPHTYPVDLVTGYVEDLSTIIDFDVIRSAKLKLGVDPLGGASIAYWKPIQETYGLDLEIVNTVVDPTFRFMTCDHDGKIRMDCSSPYAMASLVSLKDKYSVAFGNDPDSDRHGIVTPSAGLLNPNHYLAVAINYLFTHRKGWKDQAVGKTLVSSGLIDRVVGSLGRKLIEVPVGFKWFADGLFKGTLGFGGEESAGASFLRLDGSVWSTDKDGIIMDLLAAEITAKTGKDPGEHFAELAAKFGMPQYIRIDQPATPAQKSALKKLDPSSVKAETLAGEKIVAKLTKAPGNGASIGGLKVVTENGWFAARPSGTENLYKIYAESFKDDAHLNAIVAEAKTIVDKAFG